MARALIIEDSQVQSRIIGRMITSLGFDVHYAQNLTKASGLLRTLKVDAVFLDIFVGDHNALLYVDTLRKLAPSAVFVLMTAGSETECVEVTLSKARLARADFVLKKPFNPSDIEAIFERTFDKSAGLKRRKHILVIEDSAPIRTICERVLASIGYRVTISETMEDAFANVDIAHVDLVLCDMFMPGMGGFKGIRSIRRTWPQVPVIAMSAGIDQAVKNHDVLAATAKLGVNAQLRKPFEAFDLVEVVAAVFDESHTLEGV